MVLWCLGCFVSVTFITGFLLSIAVLAGEWVPPIRSAIKTTE